MIAPSSTVGMSVDGEMHNNESRLSFKQSPVAMKALNCSQSLEKEILRRAYLQVFCSEECTIFLLK